MFGSYSLRDCNFFRSVSFFDVGMRLPGCASFSCFAGLGIRLDVVCCEHRVAFLNDLFIRRFTGIFGIIAVSLMKVYFFIFKGERMALRPSQSSLFIYLTLFSLSFRNLNLLPFVIIRNVGPTIPYQPFFHRDHKSTSPNSFHLCISLTLPKIPQSIITIPSKLYT